MANDRQALSGLDTAPWAGRIRSRKLSGGVATLILDSSGLGRAERQRLELDVRETALGEPGVAEVRIALTASEPKRQMIAIGSGKGGVGKSTLAANIAIALARTGRRVGLIDADIYGPSQPTLLGCDAKPTAADDRLQPVAAHGLRFLSLGQLVSPGHALAWRGPMATGALARLVEADWGDCDLLIVDLPPGTGDVQLSLIQKSRPDGAIIVSTPQDLALIDAARAIDLFRKTEIPVLGIVENMATYLCPHCGEASHPFGSGGAEREAERLGVPFLGRLPLSSAIRSASDTGKPVAVGDGEEAAAFAGLARALLAAMETRPA